METLFQMGTANHPYHRPYPTYEEWKHHTVLSSFLSGIPIVLILPMRNGNSGFFCIYGVSNSGPYPTYEEWKPIITPPLIWVIKKRPYPTYEEWKLYK